MALYLARFTPPGGGRLLERVYDWQDDEVALRLAQSIADSEDRELFDVHPVGPGLKYGHTT